MHHYAGEQLVLGPGSARRICSAGRLPVRCARSAVTGAMTGLGTFHCAGGAAHAEARVRHADQSSWEAAFPRSLWRCDRRNGRVSYISMRRGAARAGAWGGQA